MARTRCRTARIDSLRELRDVLAPKLQDGAHVIRDATAFDIAAIADLYAHYVRTSAATFEEEVPHRDEMLRRLQHVQSLGLPWLVAIDPDGGVSGYAYAAPYRTRSAYRYALENSVYVAPDRARQGIGRALMLQVIDRCARLGYRQMLAVIGDRANHASIALHEALGFEPIGVHPAVGFKFGRWIDVVHMQLELGEGSRTNPAS